MPASHGRLTKNERIIMAELAKAHPAIRAAVAARLGTEIARLEKKRDSKTKKVDIDVFTVFVAELEALRAGILADLDGDGGLVLPEDKVEEFEVEVDIPEEPDSE